MNAPLPPITKLSERLLCDIEQAVRGFARYHKYSLGSDLHAPANAMRAMDEDFRALLAIIDRGFIRVQDRLIVEKVRARLAAVQAETIGDEVTA